MRAKLIEQPSHPSKSMWPSLLPNVNARDGVESSIQAAPICVSLRIVKADWGGLVRFREA